MRILIKRYCRALFLSWHYSIVGFLLLAPNAYADVNNIFLCYDMPIPDQTTMAVMREKINNFWSITSTNTQFSTIYEMQQITKTINSKKYPCDTYALYDHYTSKNATLTVNFKTPLLLKNIDGNNYNESQSPNYYLMLRTL